VNWLFLIEALSPVAAIVLVWVCLLRFKRVAGRPRTLSELPHWLEEATLWCTSPLVYRLAKYSWMPTFFNGLGLTLSLIAGSLYALGTAPLAGWVLLLAGLSDTLDGRIARQRKAASRRGAFTDSVLDRYSEMAIYTGLAWHFREGQGFFWVWAALFFSLMVSYTRARAEGLGYALKAGLMQRPQRLTLLILASIFGPAAGIFQGSSDGALLGAVGLIAILTAFTAVHRFIAGCLSLEEKENKP